MKIYLSLILIIFASTAIIGQSDVDIEVLKKRTQNISNDTVYDAAVALSDIYMEFDKIESKKYIALSAKNATILDQKDLTKALSAKWEYLYNNKLDARNSADSIISNSNSLKAKSIALEIIGRQLQSEGAVDSSIIYYQKSIQKADIAGYNHYKIVSMSDLIHTYIDMKKFQKSDSIFNIIVSDTTLKYQDEIVSKMYYYVASNHMQRGLIDEGSQMFYDGYKLSKNSIYKNNTIGLMNQLAIVAFYTKDTIQAIEYWKEGLELITKENLTYNTAIDFLRNCGILNIEIENIEFAERVLNKTLEIAITKNDTIEQIGALGHLAKVHANENKIELSNIEINKILPYINRYKDHRKIYNALNGVIPALIKNNRAQEAIRLLPIFKSITEKTKHPSQSFNYYDYAYKIYKNLGDYETALTNLEEYHVYHDMMEEDLGRQKLLDAKERFEAEEKEIRNKLLENKNEIVESNNQKMKWILLLLASLLSGLTFLFYKLRKASKIITEQNRELATVNKTKDRLFAIISHDLRSEVSAFQSLSNIFTFHLHRQNYDRLSDIVKDVDRSANNVFNLMDNLLQWSSSQLDGIQLKPEKLLLKNIVFEILKSFSQFSSLKKIRFTESIPNDTLVLVDENSLQFILRNIISNALKYTNSGGHISIDAYTDKNFTIISISDTGIGISTERQAHLWDIQNKRSSIGTQGERGTGIGLAMVKDFVERNGGSISLTSKLDEGTTVKISLPYMV